MGEQGVGISGALVGPQRDRRDLVLAAAEAAQRQLGFGLKGIELSSGHVARLGDGSDDSPP